jgi:hypothetical protein
MSLYFDIEKGSILHKKMMIWSSFSVMFTLIVNAIIIFFLTFDNNINNNPSTENSTLVLMYAIWMFYSLFSIKGISNKTIITHAPITLPIYFFLLPIYRILRNKYPYINNQNFKRKRLIKKWGLK